MTPQHLPLTPGWLYFAYPWALVLLALLPALWWHWSRRSVAVVRFSDLGLVRAAAPIWRTRLRVLLPVLRSVALACLVVAVARPQRADETTRIFTEGIAIQLVLDTSGSMNDNDLAFDRTRLDVVKDVVRDFVMGNPERELPGRENDLIGVIRFARFADSVCPLTLDHEHVMRVLDDVEIVTERSEDGTAIGDGLGLAVTRLRDLERTTGTGERFEITSRVVILLTDGENNFGMIAPEQAGELAATYGIRVYTILAGTGRVAGFGYRLAVDDAALRHIADVTGGEHFRADDAASLAQIYAEIDELERTSVEERKYVRFGELAHWWLVVAFGAIALQALLQATWMRKIP